jgi:hypothetical protein
LEWVSESGLESGKVLVLVLVLVLALQTESELPQLLSLLKGLGFVLEIELAKAIQKVLVSALERVKEI